MVERGLPRHGRFDGVDGFYGNCGCVDGVACVVFSKSGLSVDFSVVNGRGVAVRECSTGDSVQFCFHVVFELVGTVVYGGGKCGAAAVECRDGFDDSWDPDYNPDGSGLFNDCRGVFAAGFFAGSRGGGGGGGGGGGKGWWWSTTRRERGKILIYKICF